MVDDQLTSVPAHGSSDGGGARMYSTLFSTASMFVVL